MSDDPAEPASEPSGELVTLPSDAERDALAVARFAFENPLLPNRGKRCPRCGLLIPGTEATGEVPANLAQQTCSRCGVVYVSAEAGARLVPGKGWLRELFRGMTYLPRGAGRIVRSPSLWKYSIVPLILNLVAVGLAFALAWVLSGWLVELTGPDRLESWTGWFWYSLSWVVYFLGLIARAAVFVVVPLLALWLIVAFPFSLLYKLVFMPFMEMLTEATDRAVLEIQDEVSFEFSAFYANLVVALIDAVFLTLLQGLLFVILLPINLIPFLGSVVWLVLPPAIFAGMDYSDINLVRRTYSTREKWRLWSLHQWRFLGYGISFCFLIAIPVVNVFVIPAACAGGALLFLELDRK
ncbi:MAG: EI24 domain-containing protein [Planctomycetota bacterium]